MARCRPVSALFAVELAELKVEPSQQKGGQVRSGPVATVTDKMSVDL
jgi:hypothetical protein